MKIFTQKIFLAVMLLATYLLGFAGDAHSRELSKGAIVDTSPAYKGATTVWKLLSEQRSQLTLSAQNAYPHMLGIMEEASYSKTYVSAAGQIYNIVALKAYRSKDTAISLAALAPGRNLIKQMPSINAYPNPSRGITLFSLNQTADDNYKIRISNTIGRVVTSAEVAPSSATTVVQLDMSSLPSGVYFYSLLVNDKTVETKRLILQK